MTQKPKKTTRSNKKKAPRTSSMRKQVMDNGLVESSNTDARSVKNTKDVKEQTAELIDETLVKVSQDYFPNSASTTTSPSPADNTAQSSRLIISIAVIAVLGIFLIGGLASRAIWWPHLEPYVLKSASTDDIQIPGLIVRLGALEKKFKDSTAKAVLENAAFEHLQKMRNRLSAELAVVIDRLEAVERAVENVERMAKVVGSEGGSESAAISLRALTQRVDSLEQGKDMSPFVERLELLEEHNESIEGTVSRDADLIEIIRRRLDSMETQRLDSKAYNMSSASALILSIGQLRSAVFQGRSYSTELSNTITVLPESMRESHLLETLHNHAGTGVLTHSTLRQAFPPVAIAILQANQKIEGDDWISHAVNRLFELFTVRRVDESASPESVDYLITRVEQCLSIDDLAAALRVLDDLTPAATVVAQVWINDTQATIDVEAALMELNASAIKHLSDM